MAAFHPKYNIRIENISMKYAKYWEAQGFIVIPDNYTTKKSINGCK